MPKITLLITLFFFQMTGAQTPDWEWVRSMDGNLNNWARCVTVDNNGDVIVVIDFVGSSISFGDITLTSDNPSHYYSEIAIIKYDNQGNVLWAKNYGGPKADIPSVVTTDNNGNIYLIGQFEDAITFGSFTLNATGKNVFITKLDATGNTIFARKIIQEDAFAFYAAIKTDTSGNVYLTGSFNTATATFGTISFNNEGWTANAPWAQRPYVAKMDSEGNYIWVKVPRSPNAETKTVVAYSLDVDAEGNVYSGGYFACNTLQFGTIVLNKTTNGPDDKNIYLVKYDPNGNEIWARNAGSSSENKSAHLWSVKADLDNNVYAAGYFANDIRFDNITLQPPGQAGQLFVVKYDVNGNVLWAKTAINESGINQIQGLAIDEANNLYAAGIFSNIPQIDFGNEVVLTNPTSFEGALFLVKFTPEGEAVWGRKALPFNGNCLVDIYCKSENEIYLSGSYAYAMTFGNHVVEKLDGIYDQFLAKLSFDPLSTTSWNTHTIKVYPNPAKDQLFINQPEAYTNYSVYNVFGAKITSGMIRPETGSIDVSTLSKGVYLLQLSNSESKTGTIRIIKE
jgi:hypothetical protein